MSYNSDTEIKGFFKVYDCLFDKYNASGTLLEIGVHQGGSLQYAIDKGFKVVGIDKNPEAACPEGATVHILNQNDAEGLEKLSQDGWDVVIDDGCHIPSFIEASFETLWPHTRKMYVIEDWDVIEIWPEHRAAWLKLIFKFIIEKERLGYTKFEMVAKHDGDRTHSYICMVR